MAHGGFSKARLARMHQVLAAHVERGTVAGAVILDENGRQLTIARAGWTHS